jgi:outer membrane protein TolC
VGDLVSTRGLLRGDGIRVGGKGPMSSRIAWSICLAIAIAGSFAAPAPAQGQPSSIEGVFQLPLNVPDQQRPNDASPVDSETAASGPYHLSLAEAKARTLESSVVMGLASHQVIAKCHALEAARKDYLPKLLNSFSYFHFDSDLGTVVTTPGIFNPATAISVPIIEQDSTLYTAAAIQPITPLLKVREAVNISAADVATAQSQKQFARSELTKGVEQLYFGLLAAQRIRGGLELAVAGARQMADATKLSDAQISLVEAQQNLLTADHQVVTLTEQLNQLVDLPRCTVLQLDDPPVPQIPFTCADDVVESAVATNPKIREARLLVDKAEAAMRLAQADYVPTVMAYSFYVNQSSTPAIQEDFAGVGMSASYVLEWGKKNDTLRERRETVILARKNLKKVIEDLQLNAAKAFHEAERAEQALAYAQQLATLNREAKLPTDPFQLKFAVKDRLESELGAVTAELGLRTAIAELRSVTGQLE